MPKRKSHKKSSRVKLNRMSLRLIILGVILITLPSIFYINETIQLAFFTPKVIAVKQAHAVPTQIDIPAINLSLPIAETAIHGSTWQISDNAVSHLTISARPGENGPIILYAHNRDSMFGPIRWLTSGKSISIHTADNRNHSYRIVKTLEVSPNEISIFNQKSETLILYTCTGFADLKRFVVVAIPDLGY